MPVTPPHSYPGVYIQEIPSGVHTITGVATSITAFVGRAVRGPVDDPALVTSYAEFERAFGGLAVDYPLTYAVQDFFLNGGSQALIVRAFKTMSATDDGRAKLVVGDVHFEAASPGAWGSALRVIIDYNGITDDVAKAYGFSAADQLFNLTVIDDGSRSTEVFRNLSVSEGARRVDRVLKQSSQLLWVQGTASGGIPDPALPDSRPVASAALTDEQRNSGQKQGTTAASQGSDGQKLTLAADFLGDQANKTGMYSLENADLFNLLCIPPDLRDADLPTGTYGAALAYCYQRRAMLIVDPPVAWTSLSAASSGLSGLIAGESLSGEPARNAAIYFPRVNKADALRGGQTDTFVACGALAGVIASTDAQRGVWKAPAGINATLSGIQSLAVRLTDPDNGELNPLGINCLRSFPLYGNVVWGARTMRGSDQLGDDYKYVPVRRLALYIEESLYRGTKWAVFEPNDEPLWSQLRLNIGSFMHDLFRQGAFQGQKPQDAYFVQCDSTTTTQSDIDQGIVNVIVGFAPLKPAEFVILYLQQMAGQLAV